MTLLFTVTTAMVWQLLFQTAQHFRFRILDQLPKAANVVLQCDDKTDNIQVNSSKF